MKLSLSSITAIWLLLVHGWNSPAAASDLQDPAFVIQAYLRATYARDYIDAYRYLSSEDRRVKDLNRYVQQRRAHYGFAPEATKKPADFIEIKPVTKSESQNRIQVNAHLKVPDFVEGSFLLPVTLQPGEEKYSGRYMLEGAFRKEFVS